MYKANSLTVIPLVCSGSVAGPERDTIVVLTVAIVFMVVATVGRLCARGKVVNVLCACQPQVIYQSHIRRWKLMSVARMSGLRALANLLIFIFLCVFHHNYDE